jgi:predicted SAM-dependent methyltransferase
VSSHALEHVGKFEVVPTLKEWRRLLKPGGLATIEVPDFEWCLKNWLWRKSTDWHLDTIFGQQTNVGEYHKTGFTYDIMLGYLAEAQLVLAAFDVIESHGQPILVFIVRKL